MTSNNTNTQIIPFSHSEFGTIRTVEIEGTVWFIAKDIYVALGLTSAYNTSNYLRPLGPDEKLVIRNPETNANSISQGQRAPRFTVISESGLYRLIMRCDKAVARPFQDWVVRDVIPRIRRDGIYVQGEEKLDTGELSGDELIQKAMELLQDKVAAAQKKQAEAEERAGELESTLSRINTMLGEADHTINRVVRCIEGVNIQKTKQDLWRAGG